MVRVQDVREFPGHIACDGESRSEIVVPIVVDEKVFITVHLGLGLLGNDPVDRWI